MIDRFDFLKKIYSRWKKYDENRGVAEVEAVANRK